jgi:hypothetical protein
MMPSCSSSLRSRARPSCPSWRRFYALRRRRDTPHRALLTVPTEAAVPLTEEVRADQGMARSRQKHTRDPPVADRSARARSRRARPRQRALLQRRVRGGALRAGGSGLDSHIGPSGRSGAQPFRQGAGSRSYAVGLPGPVAHPACPAAESRRSRSNAALISARCVKACGKLPRCCACGPSSSP